MQVNVEVPLLGRRDPTLLGRGGVELRAGGLHGALDLRERAVVGDGGEVPVHVGGGVHRQRGGLLRDPAGLPHRHLTGGHPRPESREPVAQLDRVPDVGGAGVGADPDRERELRDRELRHRRRPSPATSRSRSAHGTDSSTGSPGCSAAHSTASWSLRIAAAVSISTVSWAAASTSSVRVIVVAAIGLPKH